MGVTGLWTVVQPCARPIKLETLNKKRLAVDASIWIYQFLKAVRDKEGNALRNSHLVGFFRRICKLLYFGIKPVFVFDGGAPLLKRETIANRRKRREGRRDDAVRTAGKLLATQMRRVAEEEQAAAAARRKDREEEEVTDNPVYVDEAFMTDKEKRQTRQFKKTDAYHLPTLDVSLQEMGAPNDPRIMSREELEAYARQFQLGEDVNLYDFSKIDFDSPFFISLPATDRYNILSAARLRSRLRMGYSKEQLESMFPDRMAFSKFQIERVKERNDLTQRLININGMDDDALYGIGAGQRIAGERNKEYVLVKDSAVEGGWALGVVSDHKGEGQVDKPIDVDQYGQRDIFPENEASDDGDEGFEDVPIEGLNRLPRLGFLQKGVFDESVGQQIREISGHRGAVDTIDAEDDSLFVPDVGNGAGISSRNQEHRDIDHYFEGNEDTEDEALQNAIEMSLEPPKDKFVDDFPLDPTKALSPPKETASVLTAKSDDDEIDFATALAQSKKTERRKPSLEKPPFDGPLPFESIKIGKSFSSEKQPVKEKAIIDDNAGGFDREPSQKADNDLPLPPWFSEAHSNAEFVPDRAEGDSIERYRERTMTPNYQFLREHRSPDVINPEDSKQVIDLENEFGTEADKIGSTVGTTSKEVDDSTISTPTAGRTVSTELPTRPQRAVESLPASTKVTSIEKNSVTASQKEPEASHAKPSPTPEFENVAVGKEEVKPEAVETEFDQALGFQPSIGARQQEAFEAEEGDDMSDPEDEDLMRQLAAEGEEHARFAATLNPASHTQNAFDYEQELKQLRSQQKKDRRDADEVTQVMITECQQLLTLFGLPYITAPMEAEAQCAELVSLGLVDGTVTDDSDIFLFGGTRVYKNMFNQSKFVECYLTSDMEKEYALHRRKLISFAHLLGSDYTEGIPGIGPVTALEILTEFPSLEEFRDWWTQYHTGMPGLGPNGDDDRHSAFHKKFKKTASKIFLPPSFPDTRVDEAYLNPKVDPDPSQFQWGVPDLNGVRNFLMATIGWSQERTDEILIPVIRDVNRRDQEGTQSNITNFFAGPQGIGAAAFAPRVRTGRKSRMEKAFHRLRREAGSTGGDAPQQGEEEGGNDDDEDESGDDTGISIRDTATTTAAAAAASTTTTSADDAPDVTTGKGTKRKTVASDKRRTRRRTKAT